jgi:hypothetical protein
MKSLPINPNVVSPIITLEIRTVAVNAAGAKDAAQISDSAAMVAGSSLTPATCEFLAAVADLDLPGQTTTKRMNVKEAAKVLGLAPWTVRNKCRIP